MTLSAAARPLPPGPQGLPIFGNLFTFRKADALAFYTNLWRTYGDVASARIGPLSFMMFVRPEHLQHILVKNPDKYIKGLSHDRLRAAIGNGILNLEGEKWFRQRKLMQPTYTPKGIQHFASLMNNASQQLCARWQKLEAGCVVDINREMTSITMQVIAQAIFGLHLPDDFREAAQSIAYLLEHTSQSSNRLLQLPLFIPTPTNQRFKRAKALAHKFMHNIIQQRRTQGLTEDLLSLLMNSRDEATGEMMTDDQLHDEVLITFFAGHETTASLLTWVWYLLSKNPAVEAQLHAELAQVLQGRTPTLEDLPKLPYCRMVLDETLRLYSPVPLTVRDTVVADEVGGYAVKPGTLITPFFYGTHRHPEFWQKPLEFYPEHFTEAAVAQRPRYAYLPFGAGQRICLGLHFAQMESALILADMAQRFQLRLAEPHDGAVKFVGVARPQKPIMLKVLPRQ